MNTNDFLANEQFYSEKKIYTGIHICMLKNLMSYWLISKNS